MKRLMHSLIGFLVASLVVLPARAIVSDSGANGFSVAESAHIAATPDKVYAALVTPSHWWSPAHTFSHDAANLSLDTTAGGCWCEKLPDRGSVQHLVVVYAVAGHTLVMRGALGPLQGLGVNGAMTIALKPAADGTDLSLTYNVGGYLKGGLASWADPVDGVLAEQVLRLKALVETGTPEPAPKSH
jgi:uncharacterized protein YndB with AHSA1/START domain